MRITIIKLFLLFSAYVVLQGCKREDAYKEFVKDGTKTYPGKALDFKAHSGLNRAKLTWKNIDAKVDRFLVYWNNQQDSLVVPAIKSNGSHDSFSVVIDELVEDNYVFKVMSYDNKGNKSIFEEAQVKVYGNDYIESLLNRGLKSATSISGNATLIWGNAEETEVEVEISYKDNLGADRVVKMDKTDTLVNLPNYVNGTKFSYKTAFLPDSMAIDKVYAATETPNAPIATYPMLDKSKFKAYVLPTDVKDAWGWVMPYLWDNNVAEGRGFHTADLKFPFHFTMDLGVVSALHELKIRQRELTLYYEGNPRKFEIWGSTSPAVDGSYTGWTKLLDCESVKPSGMAPGPTAASYTAADKVYALAGESFIFPANSIPVRYIRFKMLSNWLGKDPGPIHFMELTFWSK